MKFTTFYFSGTGNTEWAVKQFNQIIIEREHEGSLISIDNIDTREISFLMNIVRDSDYIGFANPIYGGNLPPVMKRFIDKLTQMFAKEEAFSKPVYIINTIAYINGFGPFCAKKLFHHTEFRLISYINIKLCNNISRPKLKAKITSHDELHKRKEAAKRKLIKMVERLLAGKKYITGIGPYLIPNILIRKISKKKIEDNYKVFSVENTTCKRCMLCVNKCPTKSIEYKDKHFSFLPSCTACMRCYNNCPTFSILMNGEYADPTIYVRYHGPDAVEVK